MISKIYLFRYLLNSKVRLVGSNDWREIIIAGLQSVWNDTFLLPMIQSNLVFNDIQGSGNIILQILKNTHIYNKMSIFLYWLQLLVTYCFLLIRYSDIFFFDIIEKLLKTDKGTVRIFGKIRAWKIDWTNKNTVLR